jgi:thermolysin
VVDRIREDTMLPGRTHERYAQLHRGVPVFGAALLRQSDGAGALTVFGQYHEGIHVAIEPRLAARDVERRLEALGGRPVGRRSGPELVVLPLDSGDYRLAWRVRAFYEERFDIRQTFYDALTGEVLFDYTDLQTQAAGLGTGVLGDRKKLSVAPEGGGFTTNDRLRPPAISTYDFRFDVGRLVRFLNLGPSDLTAADLASDADNDWADGAVVDAHVYAGWVYDFFFKRFGRRGLNDADIPLHSITHALRREQWQLYTPETVGTFFANAIYLGDGVMYYGDGLPADVTIGGRHWNYVAGGLDVVAHELTHGITDYTSQLIYWDHSGALSEAFSDVMATAAEFALQPEKADYLAGEDVVTPGGVRSLQNPKAYGYPDHVIDSDFRTSADNGGVHYNSTIMSHSYYLAVEGGTHRMGAVVKGVGAANREQIDKIWYRAFVYFVAPRTPYSEARTLLVQSARELYGVGSPAEQAIDESLRAVGLTHNSPPRKR